MPMKPSILAALVLLSGRPCHAILDQDGDGQSDFWQQMHPGLDPAVDSDGDGFSNGTEAVAGTDPLNRASRLKLDEFGRTAGQNSLSFRWQGVKGKAYVVERFDPQEGSWSTADTLVTGLNGPAEIVVPTTAPSGIFRLRVTEHDGDGDGLSAWEEGLLGYSDDSATSSGQTARQDFSAALRTLEGSGSLQLADGSTIPKRTPVRDEVTRFLVQASFGPDPDLIDHVMTVGIGGWMDEQLNPAAPTMTAQTMRGQYSSTGFTAWWGMGWWKAAMTGSDQLRLRMGNALSQILVVSNAGSDNLRGNSFLQADYYDMLLQHSLGSYRDLLEDMTYSAQMGLYLSHLQNRKSDPLIGRFPDENFAREIMQLFTIGLWELNPDGSRKVDGEGNDIPTYDNSTIMEMAKVFTGFGLGGPGGTSFFAAVTGNDYVHPMKMWEEEHEPGEKHLFNGVIIPAGQTGAEDIDDALDALAGHPNIGPFVSRLLIQRFTSSNPSPDYIRRVAAAWDDNGSAVKGDLKAVIEAILMDPEARTPEAMGDASGKVREPFLRMVAMLRAFKARNARTPATFPVWPGNFAEEMGQQPLWAPSVFNFYLPDHRPAGELRERGLFAPELEIATGDRLIHTDNRMKGIIDTGLLPYGSLAADYLKCDFTEVLALAMPSDSAPALVDHLDSLLTWGSMSASTRQTVILAVESAGHPSLSAAQNADFRVKAAVHLVAESPDFVILK